MKDLESICSDMDMVNAIDWDMTPEEAVTLYLEWGNNWSHGRFVRSKDDVSHYFVVNAWENPPRIMLIRRNSEEAVELVDFDMPEHLRSRFLDSVGHNGGVYAPDNDVKTWLRSELEC